MSIPRQKGLLKEAMKHVECHSTEETDEEEIIGLLWVAKEGTQQNRCQSRNTFQTTITHGAVKKPIIAPSIAACFEFTRRYRRETA